MTNFTENWYTDSLLHNAKPIHYSFLFCCVAAATMAPFPIPSPRPITQHATHLNNKESHWREIKLTARVECGASIHTIFLLTVRLIRMFLSLKPPLSQGKLSLKISGHWGSPFLRS